MKLLRINIVLFFVFVSISAQNNTKLSDSRPYQTKVEFDTPLAEKTAIDLYLKKNHLGKFNDFVGLVKNTDKKGTVHQRHQQYYKGLKVEFGTLITHTKDGLVSFINGEVYNASQLNIVPTLTANEAFQKILQLNPQTKYLWEDKQQADLMEYKKPEGELLIFPNARTGEVKLAYKFDIYSTEPLARDDIYVDAQNGQIIFKNPIIKHANGFGTKVEKNEQPNTSSEAILVQGTAATKYSGSRNIQTTFDSSINKYVLLDETRGNGIVTYNNERHSAYQDVNFSDTDNNWTFAEYNNTNKDIGALDAHWGAEMTYDFWMSTFGRNSYDNNGAIIKSYVHYRKIDTQPLVNAFWNGYVMSYGDGNSTVSILTSIDVCGHEIGHAVCSNTANLVYANQSGAMNEGYSDIWGACIEHFGRTGSLSGTPNAAVWEIAEDLGSSPFRSMIDPLSEGNPDTYLGTNWTDTADDNGCSPSSGNDYCGVHNNSGVLNHWFYLLTAGGTGTNTAPFSYSYSVNGIGMLKSAEIAFLAERDYLTPNATYLDLREATISVAADLYCATSAECESVTNAWYAVNVGDEFVTYSNDVMLKKIISNTTVACGANSNPSIEFQNAGTNAISTVNISYSIDGGALVNLVWNGNLGTCQSINYPINIGSLPKGTHSITVSTTFSTDENSSNDTRTGIIVVNDAATVNVLNTFESNSDNLISYDEGGTNNLWQRGLASGSILSNALAQNSKVYGTNLSGIYPNQTLSYLVSQCYNLTNIQNPLLKFDMAFDLEDQWDLIYMEYTTNGGNSWEILGDAYTANWYNSDSLPNGSDCFNCVGAQWTGTAGMSNPAGGTNGQKRQYSWDLSDFGYQGTSPQSSMVFRFVFQSDEAVQKEGAIIDNFGIVGTVLSVQENTFDSLSVTPNPTSDFITISMNTLGKTTLELYDTRGRNIFKKKYDDDGNFFNQNINLNDLSKGIYLLKIDSNGNSITKKVIVK